MGVLDGIRVLDLSWGISGPMAGMLLADHGAEVTRIERPEGDPFPQLSGYRVWHRGKRSALLDLTDATDHDRFLALAREADVLIESFSPGTTARLGIDYDTLAAHNPRLIYCSITAYGPEGPAAGRPGIDALVAARTGHQWEVRGIPGSTVSKLSGSPGPLPDVEVPDGCWVGPDRDGPLFSGVPWVSLATFYIATVAVNAAIRARQITGQGQHIQASLLHGVLATTIAAWQKVDHPDMAGFQSWVVDPRAPKGFFRSSDGRWVHHWVPLPEFIINAAANGMNPEGLVGPRQATMRVGSKVEDMVILHAYQQQMEDAVGRYSARQWNELAAQVGVPVQTVRSPEEALLDPLLVADGCVTEVADPEVGPIRQVGRVVELSRHPSARPEPAPRRGQHTDEVRAQADAARRNAPTAEGRPEPTDPRPLGSPLEGVTVLDLGLAVAGPFGTQVLAQLGARVIKVNSANDEIWFRNHIAMTCNRDKDSIVLDLKDPEGMAVLHRLVERADVVQHNMRYEAAERLGVDYESLKRINPALIYCHTLGHEQGPRQQNPGNDQTGAALAGTTWLDGGLDDDGRPIWSCTSLGDTGNGFLSAIGIIQALYDRDRTGSGQFIRTSILYAQLLNASTAWISPDGAVVGPRQRPDREQYGWDPLYRLYQTADGWLCLAAVGPDDWPRLCQALGRRELADDSRFADAERRQAHRDELVGALADAFATRSAAEWFTTLDGAGVPCEISDPDYAARLFADPQSESDGLLTSFEHPIMGHMTMAGLSFDMSATPGVIGRPPLWPGQDTRRILAEVGYNQEQIEKLLANRVAIDTGT
jgi:crotonobetainyl-CoA:carnitine CoA-transferase CaiB-like acyl-CoA transferase